jgi:hypothetical protein
MTKDLASFAITSTVIENSYQEKYAVVEDITDSFIINLDDTNSS